MIKQLLILTAVSLMMIGCANQNRAKINGQFFGYNNKPVYVEKYNSAMMAVVVDSITTDENGVFSTNIGFKDHNPLLVNLRTTSSYVPLLLFGGEEITVSAIGNQFNNYTVEGSEGSSKIREFVDIIVSGFKTQDSLINRYSLAETNTQRTELGQKISRNSIQIKRNVIKYVVLNSKSLAVMIPLYLPLWSGEYLLSYIDDHIYYKVIADSLNSVYPTSEYVISMVGALKDFEQTEELEIVEAALPEIKLKDAEGKEQLLSSVLGNGIVLLDFTQLSAKETQIRANDLVYVHKKFKERGFQIYQVCVDQNRAAWLQAVMQLRPEFVCVHDQNGVSLGSFNVPSVPYSYLISKDMEIVGRDFKGAKELENAIQTQLKKQ